MNITFLFANYALIFNYIAPHHIKVVYTSHIHNQNEIAACNFFTSLQNFCSNSCLLRSYNNSFPFLKKLLLTLSFYLQAQPNLLRNLLFVLYPPQYENKCNFLPLSFRFLLSLSLLNYDVHFPAFQSLIKYYLNFDVQHLDRENSITVYSLTHIILIRISNF